MNKQEIQQQIKEARKRHSAELKALEAKLNEPDKWEPKGGDYVVTVNGDNQICIERKSLTLPKLRNNVMRCQSLEDAYDLVAHLERQVVLWQLANDLNDGWEPDWTDGKWGKWFVYFNHHKNYWDYSEKASCEVPTVYFKDEETAKKACEILNNQPELMR